MACLFPVWFGKFQSGVVIFTFVGLVILNMLVLFLGFSSLSDSREQSHLELSEKYVNFFRQGLGKHVENTEIIAAYASENPVRYYTGERTSLTFRRMSAYLTNSVGGALSYAMLIRVNDSERREFESYTSKFWRDHFDIQNRTWEIRAPYPNGTGIRTQVRKESYGVVVQRYPYPQNPDFITINLDQLWSPVTQKTFDFCMRTNRTVFSERVRILERGYGMVIYSKIHNRVRDAASSAIFEYRELMRDTFDGFGERGVKLFLFSNSDDRAVYLDGREFHGGRSFTEYSESNSEKITPGGVDSQHSTDLIFRKEFENFGKVFLVYVVGTEEYSPCNYTPYIIICVSSTMFFLFCLWVYLYRTRQGYYYNKDLAIREKIAHNKLMGYMCHELRNPVHSIGLLTEQVITDPSDTDSSDALEKISSVSKHMYYILNDFLDFNKFRLSDIEVGHVLFNITDVVRDCYNQMSVLNTNPKTDLKLSIEPHLDLLKIVGDPVRTRQVLTNGLSNAIKFTDSGEILVSVKNDEENSKITIKVIDSGPGLGGVDPETLFKDYNQGKSGAGSASNLGGSTGLGLGIARTLIRMMGGDLNLRNRVDGQTGTEFEMFLPSNPDHTSGSENFSPGKTPSKVSCCFTKYRGRFLRKYSIFYSRIRLTQKQRVFWI